MRSSKQANPLIEAAVIGRTEAKQSEGDSNTLTIHHQDKKLEL